MGGRWSDVVLGKLRRFASAETLGVHFAAVLFMGPCAAAAIIALRQVHLVARTPIWVIPALLVCGQTVTTACGWWWDRAPTCARLHTKVAAQAIVVTAVIYATGWGPALAIGLVLVGSETLTFAGLSSQRAVLGWSLACLAAGQAMIALHWVPTLIPQPQVHGLAFLTGIAIAFSYRSLRSALIEKENAAAQHRAVVENAAEGIYTVDMDGTIRSFNAAAEAMFAWPAGDIIGRSVLTLTPPEMHGALSKFLAAYDSAGDATVPRRDIEIAGVRRDGTEFPMMASTSVILIAGAPPLVSCIARDLSDQKRFEAQLAHQARHDALTGLPNRSMLTDHLEQALARVRRRGQMCGVLFVDLDRFKAVNDTLGHASGDVLLVEAAARVRGVTRETDTVARLGGDEFVVLCEDIDGVHHVTDLARRIINALQAPFQLGEDDAQVSASIGIALSADGTEAADALIANADLAMYRAKQNGRSCYELFDDAMQQWVLTQTALEAALRHAVARDELRLFCQPVVQAETGAVRGFEVLVRWERPGVGLVAPDAFIPIAEETGLIVDIGTWVLEQACHHAAGWAREWPDRRLRIAVNVSSRQLVTGEIVDVVRRALARTGLDPRLLTLELTESTLIDDAVRVAPLLHELRALGVNIALDDFGTGYSSLTYLRAFPVNIVKIDKSFVRAIGTDREDTAIVAAVIALAHNLDLRVVAEGIDTHEQLAVLLHLGCPYMQGFLFSDPKPIAEAPNLIRSSGLGLIATPDAPR